MPQPPPLGRRLLAAGAPLRPAVGAASGTARPPPGAAGLPPGPGTAVPPPEEFPVAPCEPPVPPELFPTTGPGPEGPSEPPGVGCAATGPVTPSPGPTDGSDD